MYINCLTEHRTYRFPGSYLYIYYYLMVNDLVNVGCMYDYAETVPVKLQVVY